MDAFAGEIDALKRYLRAKMQIKSILREQKAESEFRVMLSAVEVMEIRFNNAIRAENAPRAPQDGQKTPDGYIGV